MNRIRFTVFILILSTALSVGSVYAAETSGSASVDFMSNYIWRGQKLSDDFVIQPSVGITYEGLGINIWSNYDNDTTAITETDFTLDYTFSVDKFGFDFGYIFYTFQDSDFDTQEIYASASYDVILNPSLTLYYDFDEGEGAFIVAAVGHSLALPKDLSVDLGASISYNASNSVMGPDSGGNAFSDFYNGEISASVSIPVYNSISITPMLAYSFPLSNDARDALRAIDVSGEKDDDIFYGGINLTLSF